MEKKSKNNWLRLQELEEINNENSHIINYKEFNFLNKKNSKKYSD